MEKLMTKKIKNPSEVYHLIEKIVNQMCTDFPNLLIWDRELTAFNQSIGCEVIIAIPHNKEERISFTWDKTVGKTESQLTKMIDNKINKVLLTMNEESDGINNNANC